MNPALYVKKRHKERTRSCIHICLVQREKLTGLHNCIAVVLVNIWRVDEGTDYYYRTMFLSYFAQFPYTCDETPCVTTMQFYWLVLLRLQTAHGKPLRSYKYWGSMQLESILNLNSRSRGFQAMLARVVWDDMCLAPLIVNRPKIFSTIRDFLEITIL